MPRRKPISDEVRSRLWSKQEGRCAICGDPMTFTPRDLDGQNPRVREQYGRYVNQTPNYCTVDHITPRSKGGSDDESNLQLACFSCNSKKGVQ